MPIHPSDSFRTIIYLNADITPPIHPADSRTTRWLAGPIHPAEFSPRFQNHPIYRFRFIRFTQHDSLAVRVCRKFTHKYDRIHHWFITTTPINFRRFTQPIHTADSPRRFTLPIHPADSLRPIHPADSLCRFTPPIHTADSPRRFTLPIHSADSPRRFTPPIHLADSPRRFTLPIHPRRFTPCRFALPIHPADSFTLF